MEGKLLFALAFIVSCQFFSTTSGFRRLPSYFGSLCYYRGSRGTSYRPYPFSAALYIQCAPRGRAYLRSCPQGQIWYPDLYLCAEEEKQEATIPPAPPAPPAPVNPVVIQSTGADKENYNSTDEGVYEKDNSVVVSANEVIITEVTKEETSVDNKENYTGNDIGEYEKDEEIKDNTSIEEVEEETEKTYIKENYDGTKKDQYSE